MSETERPDWLTHHLHALPRSAPLVGELPR